MKYKDAENFNLFLEYIKVLTAVRLHRPCLGLSDALDRDLKKRK